jgi:uncharacterized protein
MSTKSAPLLEFSASVVSQLACPACYCDLCLDEGRLICAGCRRAYPVIDGIPVLIVERAETTID